MPAGEASSALLPGGPGIMPAGITTGVRGASLEVGREAFPRSLARIAPKDHTPLGKSRGGTPAGERARKRRGGASRLIRGATRAPYLRAGTDDSATAGVPLSFICRKRAAKNCSATSWNGPLWLGWLGFSHRSPSPQAGGGKQIGCLTSLARHLRPREQICLVRFKYNGVRIIIGWRSPRKRHDPQTCLRQIPALFAQKNPKTGKRRNLGTFNSRAAAEKHERAVQYFKRH